MSDIDLDKIDQKISDIEQSFDEIAAEAATLSELTKEYAKFHSDQSSALLRWVMAACLSINGAAILAAFSIESVAESSIKPAVFLFLFGICSAIIAGTAFANVGLLISSDYTESSLDLKRVSRDRPRTSGKFLPSRLSKLHRTLDVLSLVPYISLLCFLGGIVVIFAGIE